MKIKVGVLGTTGYTGAELLRLLVSHVRVEGHSQKPEIEQELSDGEGISGEH